MAGVTRLNFRSMAYLQSVLRESLRGAVRNKHPSLRKEAGALLQTLSPQSRRQCRLTLSALAVSFTLIPSQVGNLFSANLFDLHRVAPAELFVIAIVR